MADCTGCGEPIHFDKKDQAVAGKWRPLNADGGVHYCGGSKKEVAVTPVPRPSQKELTNLQEQLVAINMRLSEITQELHIINMNTGGKKGLGRWRELYPDAGSYTPPESLEEEINKIDFDKMFSEDDPI